MLDNKNYLLYTTIRNLLIKIEKNNQGKKKSKKMNEYIKELKIAIDELFLSKQKYFDNLFDHQLMNLRDRCYPQVVIDGFCEMKSQVIGQLVETGIDSEFTKIPFVLVVEQGVSDDLLPNIKSKIRIIKSFLRFPRSIFNKNCIGYNSPQVLLDIQFHDCRAFDSLKELKDHIEKHGRYCITLCEFDHIFLHYPETFGRFHCAGTYYERPDKILSITISQDEATIGAVPCNGYYYGTVISCAYKIY